MMQYPAFFDQAPTIKLYDPLGELLGAFTEGEVTISYYDCAKFAGHSCPTVASAYLMTMGGIEKLYPEGLPQRSQIKIEMKAPKDEGVTGVIGNVIAYILGANDESGFKGIGGTYSRNNLLSFNESTVEGMVQLTRIDTGASVTLSSDTSQVPGSPEMMPLMQKAMQDMASETEQAQFRALWQGRVESMLLDPELQQKIITIHQEERL
jgi:formylmethanofuran dehydrogenase subunit E